MSRQTHSFIFMTFIRKYDMANATTNVLCGGFVLVYHTHHTQGVINRKQSAMPSEENYSLRPERAFLAQKVLYQA